MIQQRHSDRDRESGFASPVLGRNCAWGRVRFAAESSERADRVASITSQGTVDGQPAKVIYYPDRRQTVLYWGGRGKPDGTGHNHATINDSSPDEFHYLRVNGRIVVDQSYNPQSKSAFQRGIEAQGGWLNMLREATRKALRFWFR